MTAVDEYRRRRVDMLAARCSLRKFIEYADAALAELEAENERLREENKRAVYGCCEECRALVELNERDE